MRKINKYLNSFRLKIVFNYIIDNFRFDNQRFKRVGGFRID